MKLNAVLSLRETYYCPLLVHQFESWEIPNGRLRERESDRENLLMNFVAANPIEVPTKLDPSSCEDNGNGGDIIDRRRRSSASLDVAATIFSSIQELEANGRNLSSLGLSSIGLGSRGVPGEMAGGGGQIYFQ